MGRRWLAIISIFVKLVGTDHSTSTFNNSRQILNFPVPVCDLDQFLDDFEVLRRPSISNDSYTLGRQCEITVRLLALGFSSSMPPSDILKAINRRLAEITGCVTKTVKWIYSHDVQHRGLKPHNVLLRPGQGYITAENGVEPRSPILATQLDTRHQKCSSRMRSTRRRRISIRWAAYSFIFLP